MILSASSINTYNDCHLQWYFTHVERRPAESPAMALGQAVHDYAEVILKKGVPLTDDEEACSICGMLPHSPQCSIASESPVGPLVDVFIDAIYPTYHDPVLVEEPFELSVEGVTYTGFIDSVDVEDFPGVDAEEIIGVPASITVRDLKTSKARPRKGKYRDPLIGYYLGARELGYPADRLLLDYIVKTKTPYYWPEEQPIPDDDEIDVWAGQVARVAASIEMADWRPTGVGTWHCSTCPHKDICGPYDRWLEMTSPIREDAR